MNWKMRSLNILAGAAVLITGLGAMSRGGDFTGFCLCMGGLIMVCNGVLS